MARRGKNSKKALRLPHNKDTNVNVGFNDAETKAIDRLVDMELPSRIVTEPKFGRATVIREHAMEGIRRRLGEYETGANNDERRVAQEERRRPFTVVPTP